MDNSFTVRLCHIKNKNHDYGFNLASKNFDLCKNIGRVEFNSSAHSAGLRQGDRIIEINNKNVSHLGYQDIVKLLKEGLKKENKVYANEILLLVVDKFTDEYFKKMNMTIKLDEHPMSIYFKSNQIGNFKSIDDENNEEIQININLNKNHFIQPRKIKHSFEDQYTLI